MAGWAAWTFAHAPTVHADGELTFDSDGDGLHDELELILGSNPHRFDTDGDGYGDGEELARGSHPRRAASTPQGDEPALRMDSYRELGRIHALTVVYIPDDSLRGKKVRFLGEFGGQLVTLPLDTMRGGDPLKIFPARDGGRVIVLDPVLPEGFVLARGGFSMAATLSIGSTVVAADSLTLQVVDAFAWEVVELNAVSTLGQGSQHSSGQIGGVYRPLTSGGGSHASHMPGQICAQATMVVGVVGAVITQEVVEAGCVDGFDAHCTAGCSGTVGLTIKRIDPAALIGG